MLNIQEYDKAFLILSNVTDMFCFLVTQSLDKLVNHCREGNISLMKEFHFYRSLRPNSNIFFINSNSDLCDADYVGYTARHLFQRVAEHKNSAIGKHFCEAHGRRDRLNESHFKILRKCQGKFDCLVFEMLYIKKFKPNLNVQSDSIRAKRFVQSANYFPLLFVLVFIELIFIHS